MSRVRMLDPHVADLIAAGEVVERPAGAVKELLENALDAGATAITVEIRAGGAGFIRVADNGGGMSAEDARAAFLRHATSKISVKEDLFAIKTLGFRGEALAAICAVSDVDCLTREHGAVIGVSISVSAGQIGDCTDAGCPEGTTVIVRNLFYNTPARLKFLKKDATEAAHISEVIIRAALSRPDVSIRYIKDGNELLCTPGGSLLDAVYGALGRDFGSLLAGVSNSENGVEISGFIGKPEAARGDRARQYFSVNGRPVRGRVLTAALEEAFKGEIPDGKLPVCVLNINMPPEQFDINIHPAKAEIKFIRDKEVFDAVYFAVKSAQQKADMLPALQVKRSPLTFSVNTNPPLSQVSAYLSVLSDIPVIPIIPSAVKAPEEEVLSLYFASPAAPYALRELPRETEEKDWRFVGEVLGGYIIAESEGAIWLIDKHAAHERVIYNRLKDRAAAPMPQTLLTPSVVSLPEKQCAVLLEEREFLENAGFEFENFGGSLLIRAAPDFAEVFELPVMLGEIAEKFLSGIRTPALRDDILHIVACKAAVKLSTRSSLSELMAICGAVMDNPDIRHCPHGRPVAIRLTRSQLERQFLR